MIREQQASDYEQITVSTAAVGFTAAKIAGSPSKGYGKPQTALVACEAAPLRFTIDGGTTPTSATGMLLNIGDAVEINGEPDIAGFRIIRQGASDGLITVQYFK